MTAALRVAGVMVAAALLSAGCERSDASRAAEPGSDSVVVPDPAADSTVPEPAELALSAELRTALEQVLRGPAAQGQTGDRHSWFSAETAGALRSASVDSAGRATVNFRDLQAIIPNASSSAGSELLLDELNATVFRIAGIRSVEYQIEGSCDRFWEWLQYGCHTVTREEVEPRLNR